ncbi:MAG: phosphatidate cytidylyltransferase [Candidatus Omnitrophica bacterium]|nr:phosphatidate cytidylyltransferase [Candidatus Omnitrophota bacterium]
MTSSGNNIFFRLITGSLLIGMIIGVLFFCPLWMFGLVTMFFTGAGLYEFFQLLEKKGIIIDRWIGLGIGLLIPFSILWRFQSTKGWELFFMMAAFFILFLLQLRRRDSSHTIVGISTALFGIFYVSWCFSFLIKLRFISAVSGDGVVTDGRWLVALLLLSTKGGDIGAYAVGSLIGRHALIPRISPSKTWEGMFGGLLFSIGGALVLKPWLAAIPAWHLAVLGVLLGIGGQLGDLSESMIKRDCQVKDSGQLLPGMGGVLDVLDSLLFASPLCYFYIQRFLA